MNSVHTTSFPEILSQIEASLVVSTYQAGRLIFLRNNHGTLNTHFRSFAQPMGVALQDQRLAVGCQNQIWEFANTPAVGASLPADPVPVDACYLPRKSHFTGNIQIHEMDYDSDGELWFVNTRFSCLATRSRDASFVQRWRPKFVSGLTPEDRCHLNGLGMQNGRPKFVTALGESDQAAGWRENKANGGIVIDIDSNEVIARGLCMPHSPRFYEDRLWVLNSGAGGFGFIDQGSGKYESVTQLPGFTRGLSFVGPLAFIGLSQVRETAVFSGIPIANLPEEERWSGLAIVNWQSGETVGFLKFEKDIHEVFSVTMLPKTVWPELINDDPKIIDQSYVLHGETLSQVPEDFRGAKRT
ncbi:MAG: TIGR03032 family protein [Planctomycetaceae bacterium]|nr:TIGR03032 family protein [Planctomycetaceae bacterium]